MNIDEMITDEVMEALIKEQPIIKKVSDDLSLADTKVWLVYNMMMGIGVKCPCCDRTTKLYPRKLEGQWMIQLAYINDLNKPVESKQIQASIPTQLIDASSGMRRTFSLMRHWGLIALDNDLSAHYNITQLGRDFLEGTATVPQYAVLYDDTLVFLGGDDILWHEAVNNRFEMYNLMNPDTLRDAGVFGFLSALSSSTLSGKDMLSKSIKGKAVRAIDLLL
jgi:hypothetical protein